MSNAAGILILGPDNSIFQNSTRYLTMVVGSARASSATKRRVLLLGLTFILGVVVDALSATQFRELFCLHP